MHTIRIGSGAGYGGDRVEPALTLIEKGRLDYIAFECLAERTIALAQREKQKDPARGYNDMLEYRMEKVLPLAFKNDVKIITNMGAANPEAALDVIFDLAEKNALKGLKIAAILGDDIVEGIDQYFNREILENGKSLQSIADRILSANAYLGVAPIVEALDAGADVIIAGRVADPALFLAPLIYEFNWALDDYDRLGKGTLVGHLLECAGQITGGYYADPGKKEVPDLWNLGFPYAEVDETGLGFISKAEGTGGIINTATCTEQMLYEIHDPARYITPDCIADFSNVTFKPIGENRVSFRGATGLPATDSYKASVGYQNGFFGEGEISYGGPNCMERAELAAEIIKKRIKYLELKVEELRVEFIGINAISPLQSGKFKIPNEVRLRVAGSSQSERDAQQIGNEVQALYTNGPAAGGGAEKRVKEVISIASILVPKSDIQTKLVIKELW